MGPDPYRRARQAADNKFSGKATVADSDKPDDLDPVERLGAADGDDRLASVRPEAKGKKPQKLKRHVFLKIDSWLDSTLWNAGYDLVEIWEEITIFFRRFKVTGWKRIPVELVNEGLTWGAVGMVAMLGRGFSVTGHAPAYAAAPREMAHPRRPTRAAQSPACPMPPPPTAAPTRPLRLALPIPAMP